jgi:RHS repeat-associated protein
MDMVQGLKAIKSQEQSATAVHFFHCDHIGTPIALTDREGNIAWAARLDPFGNLLEEYNPHKIEQNIRLPGQYHDRESDLYYNRHRYYDPKIGAYINQDPIGVLGGVNLSKYADNPLQQIDPRGLQAAAPGTSVAVPPEGNTTDAIVDQVVARYNSANNFTPGDAEYLNPDTVKAMIRVESGCKKKAYKNDPMQVNNPGDWDDDKSDLGLTKGVAPGQQLSIEAGVQWLAKKAYIHDAQGNPTFGGWERGVSHYNGGGNPNYMNKYHQQLNRIELTCPKSNC